MKIINLPHPATAALVQMDSNISAMSDEQLKSQILMSPEWINARINFIKKLYPLDFFKNKTLLELGSCDGYIGNAFSEMGCDVTCVEGKNSYCRIIKNKFPHLKLIHTDCDTEKWEFGKFDIIINFGILYHLQYNHETFLTNCINNCNIMFLESVIYDSPTNELYYREELGVGQGLSGIAGTPSTSFVENILQKSETTFTKYSDPTLNGGGHIYDWIDCNGGFDCFKRRLWIVDCTKI